MTDHNSNSSLPKTPVCPACIKPMALRRATPDARYDNLQHVLFECACGWTSDQLIAISGEVDQK